jgi:hypothetical protein
MSRYTILNHIKQLDAEKDHHEIITLITAYEFPFIAIRALEFALFRTYAVPSISKLLHQTRQFEHHGQRRYDDTALIVSEISKHGYDSERGRAALRRMNHLHGRFEISNDDFLYVLSTFIYEPIRWIDRFGWRKLIDIEKEAFYYFWREVGKRMNIFDIPESYAAFEQFNIEYEHENFQFNETNYQVGEATVRIFLDWYPVPLHPMIRPVIYSLIDEPLRVAFGFPRAPAGLTTAVETGLKLWAGSVRLFFPTRKNPWFFKDAQNRTYPFGYKIERLGPHDVTPDREIRTDVTDF